MHYGICKQNYAIIILDFNTKDVLYISPLPDAGVANGQYITWLEAWTHHETSCGCGRKRNID